MSLLAHNSKISFQLIFCAVLIFALAGKTNPAGALDTTFGTGGIAQTTIGNRSTGYEVAIQPDGKIVVAGSCEIVDGNLDFAVARFNPNGTPDTSFDGDGKVQTPIGTGTDTAYTVAIQADGKILVAGVTVGMTDDSALVRYNADGSLDTTFDGDGKLVTPITAGDDSINSVALQPDGKIVTSGTGTSGNAGVFAVARYNADGSLDTSFNGTGTVTTVVRDAATYDISEKVIIQPDGKIVAVGRSYSGVAEDNDFAVVRYNANGTLDQTFDGDGKLTTNMAEGTDRDEAYGGTLQPDGKILAVGTAFKETGDFESAVARYNTDGSLDTTFSEDGKAYIRFSPRVDVFFDAAVLPDGKIVAAGRKSNPIGSSTPTDLTVARLGPNGSPDTTFDADGMASLALPPGITTAYSTRVQPNGKILAVGYSFGVGSVGANSILIARFTGDVNTADFDGDTKTDISIFRPSNGQWWYQRSSDNQVWAFQFGNSTDKIAPGDYTGDGKTDIAVWRPSTGEWFVLRSDDFSYFSIPFGTSGDVPAPADFDGDGRTDEAVFRPSNTLWYILKSSGGTTIQQFGADGDIPFPADYDGDGKADIAIFRLGGSPNGSWWIRRSSDLQIFATHFGDATDTPIPCDYTGDGKTDLAFWRSSTGVWYVVRSEDFSYYAFPFGTNGDVPAQGDYDGDGICDAAVFRPSSATWYVQRSTAGTLIQTFGLTGDKPVPSASARDEARVKKQWLNNNVVYGVEKKVESR